MQVFGSPEREDHEFKKMPPSATSNLHDIEPGDENIEDEKDSRVDVQLYPSEANMKQSSRLISIFKYQWCKILLILSILIFILCLLINYQSQEKPTKPSYYTSNQDTTTKNNSISTESTTNEAKTTSQDTTSVENDASVKGDTTTQSDSTNGFDYLAICMVVRDQGRDLKEFFIHHYHHLGIRRFYIIDDASTPPLSTITDYGIPLSAITFVYYTKEERTKIYQSLTGGFQFQNWSYDECFRRFGTFHTWLGFIDADEFLEMTSPKKETLTEFLQSFENIPNVGAVGVNWQIHTSSGLLTRPESCRQAFTTCLSDDPSLDNVHIKSFVKTKYYHHCITPHNFATNSSTITVGENGDYVEWAYRRTITRNRIALHHYVVKSKEEYAQKIIRGDGTAGKQWDFWNHIENAPHVPCSEMTKYDP